MRNLSARSVVPSTARRFRRWAGALWFGLALAGRSEAGDGAAPLDERPPSSFRESFAWRPVGSLRAAVLTGLAQDERRFVAVSQIGEVWVREVSSPRWTSVLAPASSRLGAYSQAEEIRLSAEVRMEEVLEDLQSRGEGAGFEEPGDVEDYGEDAAEEASAALPAEAMVDPEIAFSAASGGGLRPRVWLPGEDRIVVNRSDGLFVSEDGGGRWRRVFGGPVSSFSLAPSGVAVVGTADGAWWSRDLRAWAPAEGLANVLVWEVEAGPDRWLAATEQGLWASLDGVSWARHGELSVPLRMVRHDPSAPGVVWVATPTSVLRSEDGGFGFLAPTGAVVSGVRDLVVISDELRVVAGTEGAWESTRAGAVWVPLRRGLSGAAAHALLYGPEGLHVGTERGLYRLEAVEPGDGDAPLASEGWVGVDELILAATRRDGTAPGRDWLGPGGQALAYLLPTVSLEYTWQRTSLISSELDAGIERSISPLSGAWLTFTWSPPSRDLVSTGVVVIEDEDDDATGVYVGEIEDRVLLNRVARRQSSSRTRVAHQVSEMYYNREQLVQERAEGAAGRSLLDAVHLELRISEVEAWLDVLTDGAVTRYLAGRGANGGGG
jgi:hypothetical protein